MKNLKILFLVLICSAGLVRADISNDGKVFFKAYVEELSDINVTVNRYGETALMVAADYGDVELMQFVINKGADLDMQDSCDPMIRVAGYRAGKTALMRSARRGHLEAVTLLLEKGANINIKDEYYGETALTYAVERGYVEIVKLLLEKDVDGHCGSEELISQIIRGYGTTLESVKILLDNGVNIESQNKVGASALMLAVVTSRGCIDMIQLFIERGANVNFQTHEGYTALMCGGLLSYFKIVELLKAAGATK